MVIEQTDVFKNIAACNNLGNVYVPLPAEGHALLNGIVQQPEQFLLVPNRRFVQPLLTLGIILQGLFHVTEDIVVIDDFAVSLHHPVDLKGGHPVGACYGLHQGVVLHRLVEI